MSFPALLANLHFWNNAGFGGIYSDPGTLVKGAENHPISAEFCLAGQALHLAADEALDDVLKVLVEPSLEHGLNRLTDQRFNQQAIQRGR
jgi:hypothetical protein